MRDKYPCPVCESTNTLWGNYEENNMLFRCIECGFSASEDELRRGVLS